MAEASFLLDYLPILIFLGLALVLGGVFLVIPLAFAPSNPDLQKNSTYECGFEPFEDARMKFDVQFYIVAILFIIVDLDVAFLFPWALVFQDIGWLGFGSMMLFLFILGIGFIYEWRRGALEWE